MSAYLLFQLSAFTPPEVAAQSKIVFWDTQRKGANAFNEVESMERLESAKDIGIQILRLAFTKWRSNKPGSSTGTFLIGNLDRYAGLIEADLKQLVSVLDEVQKLDLKVVLTTLSLPGNRWRQHNGNKNDLRIWQDKNFQKQAVRFWRDLAARLKDHPAIVAYNLKNEPDVELSEPRLRDWYSGDYESWCKKVEGTTSDLSLFYSNVIKAVREVDPETPIVVDSGFYSTPWGFKSLRVLDDDKVIYSFHMYEPYSYTYYGNRGKYKYPGPAPIGESDEPETVDWNRGKLKEFLKPVIRWAEKNKISPARIFVGEFGVFRQAPGAAEYLKDLISVFDEQKWHWAFYSYREDGWAGMDYELGARILPQSYWDALERGENPSRVLWYGENPLFDAVRHGLKARQ